MKPGPFIFVIVIAAILRKALDTPKHLPELDRWVLSKIWVPAVAWYVLAQIPFLSFIGDLFSPMAYCLLIGTLWQLREQQGAKLFLWAFYPIGAAYIFQSFAHLFPEGSFKDFIDFADSVYKFSMLWMLGFGIYALVQTQRDKKKQQEGEQQLQVAEARKSELEYLVSERTLELTTQKETLELTLNELRSTQSQLVHAEKMASLGELTAGIAHEIQNPLNFVNNFSELSVELAQELREELEKPNADKQLILDLANDLLQNQEKINHHGKRAASIVTGMLQHARTSTGIKESVDLNLLADEYLRLSYHGLRAKNKSFNANTITQFDPTIGKTPVILQDIGRVLLNLTNNAFYAVQQREKIAKETGEQYMPTVTISTKRIKGGVEICVRDNGTGIPENLKAKIFQPFFTTKPTGEGTGLGLSISYDIVTKGHGGTMRLESVEDEGTAFFIRLPSN
jgi:two-component system, NtrC family, sensor kinase